MLRKYILMAVGFNLIILGQWMAPELDHYQPPLAMYFGLWITRAGAILLIAGFAAWAIGPEIGSIRNYEEDILSVASFKSTKASHRNKVLHNAMDHLRNELATLRDENSRLREAAALAEGGRPPAHEKTAADSFAPMPED